MPIDPDAVGATGESTEFSWTSTDSLLYALSVGAGMTDPTGFELEFTTENTRDVTQRALPTQVVVLGGGGRGPDFGTFDPTMLVHGEQAITLHRELPPAGTGVGRVRVAGIYDKGKAALVVLDSEVTDTDGNPLWTSTASLFIRGEGGWGGPRSPEGVQPVVLPDREPDIVTSATTRPDQALLYRLNGDRNPLHSDPSFAAAAGFPRPILHGLCTYGFTGRLLLHAVCDSDPARFGSLSGRFSHPVFPGDTLEVDIWNVDDTTALFQTRVGDQVVLAGGRLTHT